MNDDIAQKISRLGKGLVIETWRVAMNEGQEDELAEDLLAVKGRTQGRTALWKQGEVRRGWRCKMLQK